MQQTQVSIYRTIGPLVLIFAQNIEAVLTNIHKLCFGAKIIKNRYTPAYPFFLYESGVQGEYIFHLHVILMHKALVLF